MISLEGKIALVTGASRGIGRATALRLAEAGADVIVNYLTSRQSAIDTAERIQAMGRRAAVVKADIGEQQDIQAMMEYVGEQFGRLDILVSNAALGGFHSLMETPLKRLEGAMRTNAFALLTLSQAAKTLFEKATGRVKVIALSSHGSQAALEKYGIVGVSKAALESLSRYLAMELGPSGVNFNIIMAGLVATDATKMLPNAEALFQAVEQRGLVGQRRLTPEDVADAALFLASPLSDMVQGQILVVDAGVSARG